MFKPNMEIIILITYLSIIWSKQTEFRFSEKATKIWKKSCYDITK